ncbi:GSCOCG00000021001-RA-CDS [Cotesia congregata]|nr:GSCOCG00000021001-RA-CDS [Cotesia congregata]
MFTSKLFHFYLSGLSFLLITVFLFPDSVQSQSNAKITPSTKRFPLMMPKKSIYYDLGSRKPYELELDDTERFPDSPLRYVSRSANGCSCSNLTCGCCAGVNLEFFNFDQKACSNITMVPEEFAMDFRLIINDNEVMKQRVTGRNPPPLCMPLSFLPIVSFCVRVYDIGIIDRKVRACVDFETRITSWPIFVLHFNCVKVGTDGVTWVPTTTHNKPTAALETSFNPSKPGFLVPEVYDEVNFEQSDQIVASNVSEIVTHDLPIGSLKV